MAHRLPNLNQLRAFEAAARLGSFKDGAEELHVTHAAISHQIKALEEYFGQPLFRRLAKGVALADAGRALALELTGSFGRIADLSAELTQKELRGEIVLSVTPFYSNRVLLPRIERFRELYPEITLRLKPSAQIIDFRNDGFDGALRHGNGDWPGLTSLLIHHDHLAAYASPEFVSGTGLPISPEEIATKTLAVDELHPDNWPDWFDAVGFAPVQPLNMIEHPNRAIAHDLALSGQGVTLADEISVHEDVVAGNLARIHPLRIIREAGMFLVFPATLVPDPRIVAFAEWLRSEVEGIREKIETGRSPG